MAKTAIPDPLRRRHMLESPLDAAKALVVADAYLEQGRAVEAVAFLAIGGAPERLEQLGAEAVQTGDVFLVREVFAALGREIDAATWRAVAEAAAAAGKETYAVEAGRQAAALEG